MRKRYDYRNQFKGLSKEQLEAQLVSHKDRLLEYTTLLMDSDASGELKIVSYLEGKLENLN